MHGSLRYDFKDIDPGEERESEKVGLIRKRDFSDFSAALSPHWLLNKKWTLGGTFMRTFRAPTTEELFSEGPHLASYSYEIGNADLEKERVLFENHLDILQKLKFQSDLLLDEAFKIVRNETALTEKDRQELRRIFEPKQKTGISVAGKGK